MVTYVYAPEIKKYKRKLNGEILHRALWGGGGGGGGGEQMMDYRSGMPRCVLACVCSLLCSSG